MNVLIKCVMLINIVINKDNSNPTTQSLKL